MRRREAGGLPPESKQILLLIKYIRIEYDKKEHKYAPQAKSLRTGGKTIGVLPLPSQG